MSKAQVLANYIGGQFRPPAGGEYLDNPEPATGRVFAKIPRSTAADVDAAAEAAKRAFDGPWRGTTAPERADFCDAIADGIEARIDEFAALESQDNGKPVWLARSIDIPRAIANFRFFAGAVRHQAAGCHDMGDAINYTLRHPLGPIGLITPWNLPLYLLSWKVAPSLACGNTVVAKPSELTPMTAHALCEVIHEAGLPEGVFNLIHGLGTEAGAPLVEHRDIAAISFTGGTLTGKRVGATASSAFKKLSLELGGKNPTLIFDDCDFDKAVAGAARAGFTNQGEICLCGSRILIQRGIYQRFVTALADTVGAMKVGDPSASDTKVGALVSAQHRDKVEGYVALAREEGGNILTGGQRPVLGAPFDQGYFFQPTVIDGLSPNCRTATEEIFGPVVTLHPFDTEAEAVQIANSVRYGLAASVWTTNLNRAHRVSRAIDTGMVWVNTWLKRDLRVPFGGVKDSGVGREGGWHSLDFYTEQKNICIQLGD
jgi:aminomuconate-semialdehyde/2-hydroxymuconate-6-semialdehyde dehydrogenase